MPTAIPAPAPTAVQSVPAEPAAKRPGDLSREGVWACSQSPRRRCQFPPASRRNSRLCLRNTLPASSRRKNIRPSAQKFWPNRNSELPAFCPPALAGGLFLCHRGPPTLDFEPCTIFVTSAKNCSAKGSLSKHSRAVRHAALRLFAAHADGHFQKLDARWRRWNISVCFALKANSNLSVLRTLANLGSGFDIVSGGEFQRVLAAGGDPRRCVFAGVGKTEEEIEFALRQNIYSSTPRANRNCFASIGRRAAEENRARRRAREPECRGLHPRKNHHRHLRKQFGIAFEQIEAFMPAPPG